MSAESPAPKPIVSLIAAVARNGVIGADQGIPWRMSTDQRRFKRLTIGKPVIMGRGTFETLGKPLVDRDNIVLTSTGVEGPGVVAAPSLEAALEAAATAAALRGTDEIFIAGGGTVYAATIGIADRLYITHVDAEPFGDAFFPAIDPEVWEAGPAELVPAGERDDYDSEFIVYSRRR